MRFKQTTRPAIRSTQSYAIAPGKSGEQAFESWGASGHTAANYLIGLEDKNGGRYVGDFDTDLPAGSYCVQVFLQAGASPADTDTLVCSRDITWTGVGEVTSLKILGNKAVHTKATGTVDYYDDDEQTILMTHTCEEGASTAVRTPE